MKKIILFIISTLLLFGCKDKFLDVKPSDALVVPSTLKDFQALLDNDEFMNGYKTRGPNSALLFAGTDEYYITNDRFNNSLYPYVRNAYTWVNVNLYSGLDVVNDWASPYRTVYYANVVLDGLKNISITPSNQDLYNNVKGSALFFRADAFYQLAQVFSQPYNSTSAKSDLGIPLRLIADVSEKSVRSTVEETYNQIKNDLTDASSILPDKPLFNTRPSKAAAFALLARMSLGMENYDDALVQANSCLTIHPDLLDFNSLNASAATPMPIMINNPEIILTGIIQLDPLGSNLVNFNNSYVDSTLYPLYANNDLRKTVFFKSGSIANSKQFKGSFSRLTVPFAGIATDEVYLIKAECLARKSDVAGAMAALNTLLKPRWKSGLFTPFTAGSPDEALSIILTERRKELYERGTRWTDLKRLNKDSRFSKTIHRYINGRDYALAPGDKRFTWQIPDYVVSFNPGMPQNPR